MIIRSLTVAALIGGCSGPRNFENDNDRLRRQVLDLTEQIEGLQRRVEAAEQQIESAEQASALAPIPSGIVRPVVARIEIAGPSRGIDTDADRSDDAVRIYLESTDRRSRFVPVVAEAEITVAAVPPGEQAITLATQRFDAKQFDDAYRSGLGGTHYTLVVPVSTPPPPGTEQLTVSVRLHDLNTGARLATEKLVRFSR